MAILLRHGVASARGYWRLLEECMLVVKRGCLVLLYANRRGVERGEEIVRRKQTGRIGQCRGGASVIWIYGTGRKMVTVTEERGES